MNKFVSYNLNIASKKILNAIKKIDSPIIYVLLKGDVGVGKTTLVKKIMKNLNVEFQISPTFSFIKYYECNHRLFNKIYHIDFYKINLLKDKKTLLELNHIFENKGLFFIEWPTNIMDSVLSKKSFVINVVFSTFFKCSISFFLNEKKWVLFSGNYRFKKKGWNYNKKNKEMKYRVKKYHKKHIKYSQN